MALECTFCEEKCDSLWVVDVISSDQISTVEICEKCLQKALKRGEVIPQGELQ